MHPELIHIGTLKLHSYGAFVAMGLLISFIFGLYLFKKENIPVEEGFRSGFFLIFGAIVGGRLIYVSVHWDQFAAGLSSIWKITDGGMVYWGAVIGCLSALWIYAGLRNGYFWRLGDIWAPAAALGLALGWVGCLLAGCCYGLPTTGSIAIVFRHPASLAPLNTPLYPTQVYYVLAELTIFCILIWLRKRKKFSGQILLWYLILESNASLLAERYRGDQRGEVFGTNMSPGQFMATLILVIAVIALLLKARKKAHP